MAVYDVELSFARVRAWAVAGWRRVGSRLRPTAAPPSPHLALGRFGEGLAAHRLRKAGYRLVATNFTAPIGHRGDRRPVTGEIDIVAYDEKTAPPTLVFVEVKTRSSAAWASPEAAVDRRKQRQIVRTARIYRRLMRVTNEPYRYDVIAILAAPGQSVEVEILPGYFSEDVFRRSRWLESEARTSG